MSYSRTCQVSTVSKKQNNSCQEIYSQAILGVCMDDTVLLSKDFHSKGKAVRVIN
jgi:hypothetical protein